MRRRRYGGLLPIAACALALGGCENLLGASGPAIVVGVQKQSNVGEPLVLHADIGGRRVEVESPRTLDDDAFTEVRGRGTARCACAWPC